MQRFKTLWHLVVMLFIPLAILLLSSNLVLRVSETYIYHFNDTQVTNYTGVDVSGSQFASSITDYFNRIGGEEFQVYEQNGTFMDPLFDDSESRMMSAAKRTMTTEFLVGAMALGIGIFLYIWLLRTGEEKALRKTGFIGFGLGIALLVGQAVAINNPDFREWLYETFIGVELNDNSLIALLLSNPFQKTYLIFASILGAAMVMLYGYIHHYITREKRIFS